MERRHLRAIAGLLARGPRRACVPDLVSVKKLVVFQCEGLRRWTSEAAANQGCATALRPSTSDWV